MASTDRLVDVYGPGTYTDKAFVPVPEDTARIFRLIASQTPGFTQDETILSRVKFTGEDYPVLPGPIKATSVAAALHAMCGVIADEILTLRGSKSENRQITVNTTHAAFWFGCVATAYLNGEDVLSMAAQKKLGEVLPNWEQGWTDTPLKYRTTALYPTKNPETWYSLHGSMNAKPVLESIGIDADANISTNEEAARLIAEHTKKYSPEELEMNNLLNGFCGSICFTPEQWNKSIMGKSIAAHPLVNVKQQTHAMPTPPIAFPPLNPQDPRPLAGVKVIELTRVIAGPEIGTILASFGADVIRLNAPFLPDIDIMQLTLNAGKRTSTVDLRNDSDRQYLQALLADTDVFIQGFRLGKMKKFGLGLEELLEMAGKRGKGIVYVSENCYGPDGYYKERPGWQQIADAAAGSAYVTGRALEITQGLQKHEAVLPSLPVSDMSTGVLGAVGAMLALRNRATKGGSWDVHASLVGVNAYALREDVGLYPVQAVQECQDRFQWGEMRGSHHVLDLLVTVWKGWKKVLGKYLDEKSGWYQSFEDSAFGGKRLSILKPVPQIEGAEGARWLTPSVPYGAEKLENVAWLT
ncbi:CoA-transferase family III domain-containing protein [Boeremia exigua]|uniref:CoA-transferase family III domain-containing protein n=1 Tax=Boeremia exigua TaxID=749465 RepID=UPI001E8D5925|nr:CoA-transferase family III domain-containing protein [Boeremia exigua]KAH6614819.1 CoA-transferase family III domain-containing protein [Boeremia exigua]